MPLITTYLFMRDAATDTFREPISPCMGILACTSQRASTDEEIPLPSEPMTKAVGRVISTS